MFYVKQSRIKKTVRRAEQAEHQDYPKNPVMHVSPIKITTRKYCEYDLLQCLSMAQCKIHFCVSSFVCNFCNKRTKTALTFLA